MNRDDIIRMARESASEDGSISRDDGKNIVLYAAKTTQFLQRFAAIVAAAEREAISDEYANRLQSDLENGVRWLNERAASEFKRKCPQLAGFSGWLIERGGE